MSVSGSKAQFILDGQILATALEQCRIQAEEQATAYFKNGFNSGGTNPIVDADVTANGLTAAKVTADITKCQQLGNFFGNAAVTQGDYRATNDAMRTG